MEPVIGNLIHFDQAGFLKGRMASDNIRRLLHIIDVAETVLEDWPVVSLDAHKAVDKSEWDYLAGK